MRELMSTRAQPRFTMVLLGTFAGLAITLTIVGLYGVMTYSVARRTREIGVRMALGAQRGVVLTMVLRDAAVLLAFGIVVGIVAVLLPRPYYKACSMARGRGIRWCWRWPASTDLRALVACLIPARRATKVDPMVALRYE
jgi:ABC-type antimicrobial peptide transport system permease subunit